MARSRKVMAVHCYNVQVPHQSSPIILERPAARYGSSCLPASSAQPAPRPCMHALDCHRWAMGGWQRSPSINKLIVGPFWGLHSGLVCISCLMRGLWCGCSRQADCCGPSADQTCLRDMAWLPFLFHPRYQRSGHPQQFLSQVWLLLSVFVRSAGGSMHARLQLANCRQHGWEVLDERPYRNGKPFVRHRRSAP